MTDDKPAGEQQVRVRLRTSAERGKARKQYEELKAGGRVDRALIVVTLKDGNLEILGQEMTPYEIPPLLLAVARSLAEILGDETTKQVPRLGSTRGELSSGTHSGGRRRVPECSTNADGTLRAPRGEGFVACGECNCSSWYVTHGPDGALARQVCTRCGNEVKCVTVSHEEGHA